MPLLGTNYFLPGKENKAYLNLTTSDCLRSKDVLNGNVLCSLFELRAKYCSSLWDVWRFRQLWHFVHFVDSLRRPLHSIHEFTQWRDSWIRWGQLDMVFQISTGCWWHPWIQGSHAFLNGWEHELNQPILRVPKCKVIDYVPSTSIDMGIKEINCKLL